MDRRELKSQIDKIKEEATNVGLELLTQDIDMFLGAANDLTGILGTRYEMLREDRAKVQKAPTKPRNSLSVPETQLDSSQHRNPSKARSQGPSRIQQGILQASKSKQQALRHEIYGSQNPEVRFAKAAKEIAG